jgi:hypothetical protein
MLAGTGGGDVQKPQALRLDVCFLVIPHGVVACESAAPVASTLGRLG